MEDYEYISTVGEGGYGQVWRCREKCSGRVVAIKGFKQAHEDKDVMRLAVREAKLLFSVDHPNIVKLLAAFKSTSGRVYMVFEYAESSIRAELKRFPQGLPSRKLKLLTWQLLHAAAYLHDSKIMHRDIKPANILLDGNGIVKLCDFGFARNINCGPRDVHRCTSYIVTRWYRAPEILVNDYYGPSSDVWSIGCTIAEMATGRVLFPGESTADQLWLIMRCLGPLPWQQAARMADDPELCVLSAPRLHKTLRQRLPELESQLFQLVEACLRLDPQKRPTVQELLQMPYFWDVERSMKGTTLELYLLGVQAGKDGSKSNTQRGPAAVKPATEHVLRQTTQSLAAPEELQHRTSVTGQRGRPIVRAISAAGAPDVSSMAAACNAAPMSVVVPDGGTSQVLPFSIHSHGCVPPQAPYVDENVSTSPAVSSVGRLVRAPKAPHRHDAESENAAADADSTLATADANSVMPTSPFADPVLAHAVSVSQTSPIAIKGRQHEQSLPSRPPSSVVSEAWEHVATPTGAPTLKQKPGTLPPHVRPTGQPALLALQRDVSWTTGATGRQDSRHNLLRASTVTGTTGTTSKGKAEVEGLGRGRTDGPSFFFGGNAGSKSASGGFPAGRSFKSTASRLLSFFSGGLSSSVPHAEGSSARRTAGDGVPHHLLPDNVTAVSVQACAAAASTAISGMATRDLCRTTSLRPQRRSRLGSSTVTPSADGVAAGTLRAARSECQTHVLSNNGYEVIEPSGLSRLACGSRPTSRLTNPVAFSTPGFAAPESFQQQEVLLASGWSKTGGCTDDAVPHVADEGGNKIVRGFARPISIVAGGSAGNLERSTHGAGQELNVSQSVSVHMSRLLNPARTSGRSTTALIPYASPVASASQHASPRGVIRRATTPNALLLSVDDVMVAATASNSHTASRSALGTFAWFAQPEDATPPPQAVVDCSQRQAAQMHADGSEKGRHHFGNGWRKGKGASKGMFSKLVRALKQAVAKIAAK
ncbi:hypothetical protein Agub_g10044 [Astrephomene gubernaculifera]|uniref:cyclin-dependent kinase n=1 Tax=Astrephomene gubernaculifera TaxID=47775 RepID=A0AAD3DUE1_9CHLO|nr:hypothetical protein Agub_g10044 [Astrephomene gubernaculifera]